ncbi:MAG: DNA-processing protein DprA [Clostridia bacterium]
MENKLYWLWLQKCVGIGYKVKPLIEYFGSVKAIYDASIGEREQSGLFRVTKKATVNAALKNMENIQLDCFDNTIETCKKYNIHILTPDDEDYPKSILDIEDYPCVLFARGDVSCLNDKNKITVIGTRKPSDYGKESAKTIISGLTEKGVTLVSGGAIGIDSLAHQGAIDAKLKTILVMGCGHGYPYLPQNAELRKNVSKNGVLITEYPPFEEADRFHFPIRNRLMSALSSGIVIIEAGTPSGTLNTAKHARNQGREVFVLPGDIKSNKFSGSNNLIKEGAKPIFSAKEILQYLNLEPLRSGKYYSDVDNIIIDGSEPFKGIEIGGKVKTKTKSKAKINDVAKEETKQNENNEIKQIKKEINLDDVSNNAKIVYNVISSGVCELDEITRNAKLPINKVLVSLTELELMDIAVSLGANKYGLKLS